MDFLVLPQCNCLLIIAVSPDRFFLWLRIVIVRGHLRQPTFPMEYPNHNPPNIFRPNNPPYIPPHRQEPRIPWTPTSPLKYPAPPWSHPSAPSWSHPSEP